MRVGVWLLWVSWLFIWPERSSCKEIHPAGKELHQRSKSQARERARHKHQQLYHRNASHRRKVPRLGAEEIAPSIVHHPSDVVVKPGNPAQLSCRAEGSPQVSLEWLQNGQPLQMSKADGQMQPIMLPEGSLFFLSVGEGPRGPSHEGVYACVARNAVGMAISRNASLRIAVLQEEFHVQPSDVEVAEGEVAVLNCGPPTGRPEPNVLWKKDGVPVNITDPHFTVLSGKLIVAPAEKQNSGSYVCVATNTVGVRESRAARLSVLAKPTLLLKPENVSVKLGESAQFYCQAKGDPPPTVVWSREQGPLPNGRYLVNPNQTLQIHYVTAQDAGLYTCTAANDVGMVTASAQLLVEAPSTKQKDLHKELSALRVDLENITIAAPGSNFSQVQWKLQALPTQPHYLDGFEVLYRSLLPASSDWAAKKVTMPSFQCQLGPLKRGFKYEFKVRPYGSNLYGRESNTQHLRVPETVPSASPQTVSISVSRQQNNTIHLSWEPPPLDTHNGILQGYQVWCVESEEERYQNWTVNSSQQKLDISALKPGKQYWITVAAVNGAGVGTPSDPHGFLINPQKTGSSHSDLSWGLTLLQDPLLIGGIGALLWCTLMIAAVCLFRRHGKTGRLLPRHGRSKGLSKLVGEDLIIKHRMAAPDSPWMSGGWRPALNPKYQDLWAHGYSHPGLRSTSLPVSTCKDPSCRDSAVPVVTDSCGVYGTFYMDLMGNRLKTFNSPGRCAKMPHRLPQQLGSETIQIFAKPIAKSFGSQEALPWKQAIRPQPRMGVLRESWEKGHNKQELHAVNSVPILPTRTPPCSGICNQRLSHIPPGGHSDCAKVSPRLLHYSASLHLLDMLPPPPPPPAPIDSPSLSTDEGSSRSTKLTVDMGSVQSGNAASPRRGQASGSSYSQMLAPSAHPAVDDAHDDRLTAADVGQYLELSPKPERCSSVLPEERSSLSQHLAPSLGYVAAHLRKLPASDEPEATPVDLRRARLQSTPSSCYSDWDSSLWSTWSSVMDGNMNSARTSLISSVDSCYTSDSTNFSRWLAAAAAGSVSGASLSDFSPPASPLSILYPSLRSEGDLFGEQERVPVWDWNVAWMEEMEAKVRAHHPVRHSRSFDV
ncbi:roundabout homolog 2 isoform X3 [Takifugu flavidus]|uniref:roundabout homolog 2 isoform X3 n=1 Tax=Takifugu flavidus TaxID=433684 RepID=UPI0025442DBA|nr:roundabout homolog 2 isoform X3 [Takifugu flavidus]